MWIGRRILCALPRRESKRRHFVEKIHKNPKSTLLSLRLFDILSVVGIVQESPREGPPGGLGRGLSPFGAWLEPPQESEEKL